MEIGKGLKQGSARGHFSRSVSELPKGLSCPDCGCLLEPDDSDARCGTCGRVVVVHGSRIPDFLDGPTSTAATILTWPERFTQHAEHWLLAVASGTAVSAAVSSELEAQQLLEKEQAAPDRQAGKKHWRRDPGSRLTALGNNLAYHCAEFCLQSSTDGRRSFLEKFLRTSMLGARSAVLDVGCGAGQTLRLLRPLEPAERVGLDIDLEALAFGSRLAESTGEAIRFLRASAYRIPFPENRFTHVICRVVLNYVHQGRALDEMVRVLQPDGYLYCSLEGPGFDVHFLTQARTLAQLVCRLRDLCYGCALAWTSVQPAPGTRLTGGRAFGTIRHSIKALARDGCELVYAETTSRYLGLPRALDLVARKRSAAP